VNKEGKSTPEHEFWPAENKSVRIKQEKILTRKIKLNLVEARLANRLVAGSKGTSHRNRTREQKNPWPD
jgi:hypothetical protein